MIYEWKAGFPTRGTSAQAVGSEIERLRRRHGGAVTPALVVEEAEQEESVLHQLFEWDDSTAAREYRLEQARSMIRSITITEVADRPTSPVRAFVSVRMPGQEEKSYTSIGTALAHPGTRAQVLAAARSELVSWRERYRELEELSTLFSTIDQQLRLTP